MVIWSPGEYVDILVEWAIRPIGDESFVFEEEILNVHSAGRTYDVRGHTLGITVFAVDPTASGTARVTAYMTT